MKVRHLLPIALSLSAAAGAQSGQQPADIPRKFAVADASFDYAREVYDIPMRDGVRLHTVLVIPRDGQRHPIMLDRTPYGAEGKADKHRSARGALVVAPADAELFQAGYILAYQGVRGKHGSRGEYINARPLIGPLNRSQVDHATDAWDTIDWLVKNIGQSNGRVGMFGTSYDGMMVAMALTDPHPALRAAVPANPVINTYLGDDDFHGGAFRLIGYDYYFTQDSVKGDGGDLWRNAYDDYDVFLRAGSASDFVRQHGLGQLPYVGRMHDHPAYDRFWKDQALEIILPKRKPTVPTLWIAGLWDQEDIYGAIAAWQAVHRNDPDGINHLVVGPWNHGGWEDDGSRLGPISFGAETARWFRRSILLPFLDANLKPEARPFTPPPVLAFATGANRWEHLDAWPPRCEGECAGLKLHLAAGGTLSFSPPVQTGGFDEYVSDPAKPIPYRIRPIRPTYAEDSTWSDWLVDDQRPFSDRTDVLTYTTPPLNEPLAIAGAPVANLAAATTGTDGDFVVKLIDVYPDEYAPEPKLGGFQLPIAMDIFRGRYREGLERAKPFVPGQAARIRFTLPHATHVFLPGHRVMVQIQSSLFPLYDRNPQTFVPNIFDAKPNDYRKATIRVFHNVKNDSSIELPMANRLKPSMNEVEGHDTVASKTGG